MASRNQNIANHHHQLSLRTAASADSAKGSAGGDAAQSNGGIRIAFGDLDGDGVAQGKEIYIISGAYGGPVPAADQLQKVGTGTRVLASDAVGAAPAAFDPAFSGGVRVAVRDIGGDAFAVSPARTGPIADVLDSAAGNGGSGDLGGQQAADGQDDLIVGADPGADPSMNDNRALHITLNRAGFAGGSNR